jgi:hypothetical protein
MMAIKLIFFPQLHQLISEMHREQTPSETGGGDGGSVAYTIFNSNV